ncbi:MAG: LysR family transcriptional regulator [Polaromonas sp.]|nr:LysR family transcriptional regulator [Polaromonas sp.]
MADLKGIRVFREIVDSGGFAAAAGRLGMSAPMVSKHLAQLEQSLGARLLNRSSRRLSLTQAGTDYLAQCRQALDILDAAAGQSAAMPRGELKISAPVWCATPYFAALLADYRRSYPEVRLDLHLDNHIIDIVSGGFDLALRATSEPSSALIARSLCRFEFHLVASPAYLAASLPPENGAQAPGPARVLDMVMPNYVQLERLGHFQQLVGASMRLNPVMKSSDTTLSYHAVRAGMGAAFLPGWLVDDDLAAGRLMRVGGSGPAFTGELFAVYASRRQMPPKLRTFIDFLVERLGAPRSQLPFSPSPPQA